MKPAEFEYVRPTTIPEAVSALVGGSGEAKVLAGGQSLVPLMNLRLATPPLLVDINRIAQLDRIEERDGGVAVGATVRQADLEASPLAAVRCPLVVEALRLVGHPQLRNRGTVVGSLAHADPAAELPAAALALGARLRLSGPSGERQVDADGFFDSYFTTAAAPDELVTEVWFPGQPPGAGSAFVELARRRGDFAMVGVAALLQVVDGTIRSAAVALSGMAARPVRCPQLEQALVGVPARDDELARLAPMAAAEETVTPVDDVHATADYRRAVLPVVVERALTAARNRAVQAEG